MGSAEHGLRAHGGALAGELDALGIDPASVLDLSVNVNPYGPAPAVLAALRAAPVHLYPDPGARAVRAAIGAACGWDPAGVVFGPGASDLLWTLARALLRPGSRALAVEPAFSEWRAAAEAAGAEVHGWRTGPRGGFRLDAPAVATAARAAGAQVVYLAAPFAATGVAVRAAEVAWLAEALPGALLVLDESFGALSDGWEDLDTPLPANVARLRSMTKEHAIPGLRAGYLLVPRTPPWDPDLAAGGWDAPHALAAALEAGRPAWSTSALAQAAALAALGEGAFVAASRDRLRRDREETAAGLRALGLAPLPSAAPYLCFSVGSACRAARVRLALLRRGVLVRDCDSFGLPGHLRVAARPAPDRARFLTALALALASEGPV